MPPPNTNSNTLLPGLGRNVLLGGALVVAVVVAYFTALHGSFLWDDDLHVTANPTIIGPLGLKEIWTTARANYFPLVLTNFWVQHALWGVDPMGYHLVTLACHALAAVILWRVLTQLRIPGALLGAALWALHPVQVESVAWICELKNTQSAVFFLLSAFFFLQSLEANHRRNSTAKNIARPDWGKVHHGTPGFDPVNYALALLCAVLALLSKPSTVMLPVALALGVWWQRGRLSWRDVWILAPFFASSALVAGWTIWEQKFHSGAIGADWSQTWPERFIIAGNAGWFYLGKLFWPEPLIFIYPRWQIDAGSPVAWLPVVATGMVLWCLWRGRNGTLRPFFFATLYFGALLFPVLGFFNVYFFRYAYVGDHFQYLASMGPLALIGAGLALLGKSGTASRSHATAIATGVLLIVLGVLTRQQCSAYLSPEALWRSIIARNPACVMARLNLANMLLKQGHVAAAIAQNEEALKLQPDSPEAHSNLGFALAANGNLADAIPHYERAIELQPDFALAYANLARALINSGRVSEAVVRLQHALRVTPNSAVAHINLGNAFLASDRLADAIVQFERSVQLDPDLFPAQFNFGFALSADGRWHEAIGPLQRATQLQPKSADSFGKLGLALWKSARLEEAATAFKRALRLGIGTAELHHNLGEVLRALGRNDEAATHLNEAERLQRAAPSKS